MHRAEQVRPKPGHPGDQSCVGRLAERKIEPHLVRRQVQPGAELGDVRRHQCDLPGRQQRKSDLAGADHLPGQGAQSLAQL